VEGSAPPYKADAALLAQSVAAAGEVALRHFRGKPRSWEKADGTPVSEADIAVDEALCAALAAERPGYGLMSEERDGIRLAARTFVIDPIDGTRAFLRGETAWCIAAAVIEDGRPVAAAVFAPAAGALYVAALGAGATRDGEPIAVSGAATMEGARVALSGTLFLGAGLREKGVRRTGMLPSLALRLMRVAEGRSDAAVTKSGPHHWDLAAADLIVVEAGGMLTDLQGRPPRYDAAETRHPPVVAGAAALAALLRPRIAAAAAALSA